MIHTSLNRLQHALQIHDAQTVDYMNQCSRELIGRILNAAKHGNLQSVIISDGPEKIKPVVMSIHAGNRMSDVRLRKLLDEMIRSETKEEKVRLIKSNFYSLHDYLEGWRHRTANHRFPEETGRIRLASSIDTGP